MNKVIIIAWPSGSGKDTLINELLTLNQYSKIISDTTREKRVWEIEWKDYFFVSKEQFDKNLEEWKYFQLSEFAWNSYAYKKDEILNKIKEKDVLLISHPQTIALIVFFLKTYKIPYCTVYLDIPKELTIERMLKRGDKEESINKRKDEFDEFIWFKKKADIVLDSNRLINKILLEFQDKTYYYKNN